MTKVSVVILNWNGRKLLEQFLPSVISYTSGIADIVVADNCSTDDSISYLKEYYPDVKLIELDKNYGFAEGYNRALTQIEAEYFVLLNSDVEVTENWLSPIIHFLDENQDVAAAQPKIKSYRDKSSFEYAGAAGGFIDKYGYPFCRGRIFSTLEKDNGQYDQTIDVLWASGACFAIRSRDYMETGGLDASFFAHMEEIDLCWRLNARGRRVVCFPESTVFHVGGATLDSESPRKTFLNFRNNLLMLYKNLPNSEFRKIYRIRKVLDRIARFQFLLTGKSENAKSIKEAYRDFEEICHQYDEVRIDNLNKTIVEKLPTIYPFSIINSYYVKGCKIYSSLKNFNTKY